MTLIVNQYSTSQDFSVPDSDERQSNVTDCVIAGLKLVFYKEIPSHHIVLGLTKSDRLRAKIKKPC
jgi:hypothetical protein